MKKRITKLSALLLCLTILLSCTLPTLTAAEELNNNSESIMIDLLGEEKSMLIEEGSKTLIEEENSENNLNQDNQEFNPDLAEGEIVGDVQYDPNFPTPELPSDSILGDVQGDPNFPTPELLVENIGLFAIGAVTIENESDLEPLFPDSSFRSVVFEAVSNGKNNATGVDIKGALANFTGDINASGLGITDATGLDLLRKANIVDLSHNEITDFSNLGKNVSQTDEQYKTWYGGTKEEFNALGVDINDRKVTTNVLWILNANPLEKLPINFGGRLVIEQPGTNSYIYKEDISQHFLYVRPENGEGISGTLEIGKTKIVDGNNETNADIITINEGALGSHLIDFEYPIGNPPDDKVNFNNLKQSGTGMVGIGCDEQIEYWTTDEWGTPTEGQQSFKYYILPRFFVYEKVSLSQDHSEEVIFTKYNEDKTKTLQGAEYSLFRVENDIETLIDENATTDANGIIKEHLTPGNYKFVETKAPEGYELNQEPILFKIEPFTPGVGANAILGGGRKTLDNLTDGKVVTAEEGKIFIAGLNDKNNNSPDVTLSLNEQQYKDEIVRVNVNYTALASLKGKGERREFHTLKEAQEDINKEKNRGIQIKDNTLANSNIIGEVKIEVLYTGYGNGTVQVEQTNKLTPLPPTEPPINPPTDPPTNPPTNPPTSPETTDIRVKKIWEDVQGWDGKHPDITIYLLRNDKRIDEVRLKDGKTTYTFRNLPVWDSKDRRYVYTIEEKPVKNYVTSIDGYEITNTHEEVPPKPPETIPPVDPNPPTYPNITPPIDPYENPPIDPNIAPPTDPHNSSSTTPNDKTKTENSSQSSGNGEKIGSRTNPQTGIEKQNEEIALELLLGGIIAMMLGTMILGRKIIRRIEK